MDAPKLLFLVTEDWYFCSHRLPVARAARDAGFEVVVATRVRADGERIRGEGFALRPLAWRRRGDGLVGHWRALWQIVRLYRAEAPDLIYHVALKPVLFGGFAVRLAFSRSRAPTVLSAVMGLGSGFADGWRRAMLGAALRLAAPAGPVIVQNPEDRDALAGLGVAPARLTLIRGSGVDTAHFTALAEPDPVEARLRVGFVGRMLRSKGVLDAVAAIGHLRAAGHDIGLLLAGDADPDSADALDAATLAALAAAPGIEWLGHVEDVRAVWRRAAIAVLPSTYGEGVPKALLEAAASARPIVASDMPGCREIVRDGATGLLVPPHDVAGLAAAIARLAADRGLRRRLGAAGRTLVEREFSEAIVAEATLALYQAALVQRGSRT